MNILQQFGSQITRLSQRLLGKKIFSTVGHWFSLTAPEIYSTIDQKNAVKDGFSANIAVYVVVKKDAEKFASATRYVYDKKSVEQKAKRINNYLTETKALKKLESNKSAAALTTLLNNPNPYQSQDAFLSLVRASYKVCGEAFIWLNRGDISQYRNEDGTFDDMQINRLPVLEMYALPPDLVTLIPDPSNPWGVLGYILEGGERDYIRAGDIIHWKDINLQFDISSRTQSRGMSPLTPGARNLEENNSIVNGSMRMAQNDGAKAVLYEKSLSRMTPQQQTDLKKIIDAKINNTDVSGSVAAIQGDWGILNLASDARAMQMIERKKFTWHEIALLFGVPPEYVVTDQKYDNLNQAGIDWVANSIIPSCKQFDGELNRLLLKAFNLDGIAFIATDITEFPEIQQKTIMVAKEMQEIWAISPDDIRELLGYDKIGDTFAEPWVPSNGRMPLSQIGDGMTEEDLINTYGKNNEEGVREIPKDKR